MLDAVRPDPNAGKSLMQLKAEAAEEARGKRKAEEALGGEKGKKQATEAEGGGGGKVTLDRGVTEEEMERYRRERRDMDFDDPLARMGEGEVLPL